MPAHEEPAREKWVVDKGNAITILVVACGVSMFLGACLAIMLLALGGGLK